MNKLVISEDYLDFSLLFFPPVPMGFSGLPSGRRSSTARKQVMSISFSTDAGICVCLRGGGWMGTGEGFYPSSLSYMDLFRLIQAELVSARSVINKARLRSLDSFSLTNLE